MRAGREASGGGGAARGISQGADQAKAALAHDEAMGGRSGGLFVSLLGSGDAPLHPWEAASSPPAVWPSTDPDPFEMRRRRRPGRRRLAPKRRPWRRRGGRGARPRRAAEAPRRAGVGAGARRARTEGVA